MKKTLIALAALAATGASFAQSSVTISGLFDVGYGAVNAPANAAGVQTGDISRVAQNGSATTSINIAGTEDLGGGMRANFRYEINPDLVNGAGFTGGAGQTAGTGAVQYGNGGVHQSFLGLQGAFGNVRLGRINTGTLAAWGTGSVFGTALGSGFGTSGIFARSVPSSGSTYFNTAPTRFNNSVDYTSPTINGFTARLQYVPQVNKTGIGAENGCAEAACTTVGGNSAAPGANRAGATDISLAYNKGPLNAMVAQQSVKIGSGDVNALVAPNHQSTASSNYEITIAAANYQIGAARVFASTWTEKMGTTINASSYSLGANYVMGAYTFAASMANNNDKTSTNADRKIMGLGVDYALSKRSALYARYESRDANKNVAADTSAAGVTKTTHVGVRHTF
jgi:predicted porin